MNPKRIQIFRTKYERAVLKFKKDAKLQYGLKKLIPKNKPFIVFVSNMPYSSFWYWKDRTVENCACVEFLAESQLSNINGWDTSKEEIELRPYKGFWHVRSQDIDICREKREPIKVRDLL